LFEPDLVAKVARIFVSPPPDSLTAADVVFPEVDPLIVKGVIKDKKLKLRPKVRHIGDLGALEERDGLARDRARIPAVFFFGDRVAHIADDRQRRMRHERIDASGIRHRHQQHVRFIDGLPPANTAAVKPEPMVEAFEGEFRNGTGGMLPEPGKIHESEVDELDRLFLAEFKHVTRCHGQNTPSSAGESISPEEYAIRWMGSVKRSKNT